MSPKAGSTEPIVPNTWDEDGIIFKDDENAALICKSYAIFKGEYGMLCTTFSTNSDKEQAFIITDNLQHSMTDNGLHFREIRVSSTKISIHGYHSDDQPYIETIPIDGTEFTTFLLCWTTNTNSQDFTAIVNENKKYYFSFQHYSIHFPGFIIGENKNPETINFRGNLKSFEVWNTEQEIPPKLLKIIYDANQE